MMSLKEIENYMEQVGMDSFGEAGFGKEYVEELKRLGVTDTDKIEMFETDYRGIINTEDDGVGRVNGRTFDEDGSNNQLCLYWLDEYYEVA